MIVVYTGEEPPREWGRALFLAGPTPRIENPVPSWRPHALVLLEREGYDGVVFVPEDREGTPRLSYDNQIEWEHRMLNFADCIIFWVPRDLQTLPAFTTNIEFGLWVRSGKIVFGAPDGAPKNDYLRLCAKKYYVPTALTLEETIENALVMIGAGVRRVDGERHIPLYIWNTAAFQVWYRAQKNAGNRIDGATIKMVAMRGKRKNLVFWFVAHMNVYVAGERRNKLNDEIITRPNIAAVMLYHRNGVDLLESKVVLVREFRITATTADGFIWELPSGSAVEVAMTNVDRARGVAAKEVEEEVGMAIDENRLRFIGVRQLAGTFGTHQCYAFGAELSAKEFEEVERQKGLPHGDLSEGTTGERTYVEVKTIREILDDRLCDWTTLGIIFQELGREAV